MSQDKLQLISTGSPAAGDWEPVAPEKLVSGTPSTRTRLDYSSPGERFHVGHWESTVGAWRVQYDEAELCSILAGRVRLTDSRDGTEASYGPGDNFVVPAGFSGIWEVVEPVRKLFAIGAA